MALAGLGRMARAKERMALMSTPDVSPGFEAAGPVIFLVVVVVVVTVVVVVVIVSRSPFRGCRGGGACDWRL